MDYSAARQNLSHLDPNIAERAFKTLLPVIDRSARQSAYSFIPNHLDPEDMVALAYLRVWSNRLQYKDEGESGFRSYVFSTTTNVCLDELRKRKRRPETVSVDEVQISTGESELIDRLHVILQAGLLESCIDTVLLDLDTATPPEIHTRQLLAAQYYYLEGATCREIMRLLPPSSGGEAPVTPALLDGWLSDPGVLRHLLYKTLWDRYAQGAANATIVASAAIQQSLDAIIKRFMEPPGVNSSAVLRADELWHRLVFQLWYVAEWSAPEIVKQVGPLASYVGYPKITRDNLNVWLSGNRLRSKCIKFIQATCGGDSAMSLTDSNPILLSPPAETLVDEQIRSALRRAPDGAPDTVQMVRYLSGALSYTEARLVERSLTTEAALRRRQRALLAELEALQQATWQEVDALARAGNPAAQAWRALVVERTEAAGQVHRERSAPFWPAIERGAAVGRAEAQAAWAAFAAFVEQIRLSLHLSDLQPAVARGGEDWCKVRLVNLPDNVEGLVRSEMNADGSLQVSLQLVDTKGQPFVSASGAPVTLELELEGEAWPLGTCAIEENLAEWSVPPLEVALPRHAGGLPASALRVIVGAETETSPPLARHLFAKIQDASGNFLSERPVKITMEGAPRVERETLHVSISLPAAVRQAYGDHLLVLDAGITAQQWQRLGAWPIGEWDRATRSLSIPCPGLPDLNAYIAPLRASLQSLA